MPNDQSNEDVEVLQQLVSALNRLDHDARVRLLHAVATFFGISTQSIGREARGVVGATGDQEPAPGSFSEDRSISPKEFLFQKRPRTDVERVACLAYYLTHYRETPHFKTLDISKVNTEAAQVKLSNAAYAVNNSMKMGYLAPASKGFKQISAAGELFVQALPDRDAAKVAMAHARPRRRLRKSGPHRVENN